MPEHLKNGSTAPSYPAELLKIYSNQYCPYVQRVALVLSHHNIDHERIFIDLHDKPDWFLAKFPEGKVPVIEKDGEKMVESDFISAFLDQLHGSTLHAVSGDDCEKSVKALFGKFMDPFREIYAKGNTTKENITKYQAVLSEFETMISGPFISGNDVGLADYLIYPVFDRMECIHQLVKVDLPARAAHAKFYQWYDAMKALPAVQKESNLTSNYVRMAESYRSGVKPNYDI